MQFENETLEAVILRRYKRFLSDVKLANGQIITAHIANTGSMESCWGPNWKVLLTKSNNPKRKLSHSLELTHNGVSWIGINTSRTNAIAHEAISKGIIPELDDYQKITREVTIGKSRIDLLLEKQNEKCYVEVKNVTLKSNDGIARFPDSVSERGVKHLEELIGIKEDGHRAVMLFIIQREDIEIFAPAYIIDPVYSLMLKMAQESGVEILAYQCKMSSKEIVVNKKTPVVFEI